MLESLFHQADSLQTRRPLRTIQTSMSNLLICPVACPLSAGSASRAKLSLSFASPARTQTESRATLEALPVAAVVSAPHANWLRTTAGLSLVIKQVPLCALSNLAESVCVSIQQGIICCINTPATPLKSIASSSEFPSGSGGNLPCSIALSMNAFAINLGNTLAASMAFLVLTLRITANILRAFISFVSKSRFLITRTSTGARSFSLTPSNLSMALLFS